MIAIILYLFACIIDAWMDRLREVHQLLAEAGRAKDMITPNKNFWSYSPMRKFDGWHFLKYVLYALICAAILLYTTLWGLWIDAAILVIGRFIVFETALKIARKRITMQNNFKT